MRTILFSTCHVRYPEQLHRYRQYLDYYLPRLEKLGASKIILIDDGSSMEYLSKLGIPIIPVGMSPHLKDQAYIFRFPEHLGRPLPNIIPGWWRSFSFASLAATYYAIDKLIYIDSDTYVLSDGLFEDIKNENDDWAVAVSLKDNLIEKRIQVIPNKHHKFLTSIFAKGMEFYYKEHLQDYEYLPEKILPFATTFKHIKGLRGDRFSSDSDKTIPANLDFLSNAGDFEMNKYEQIQKLIGTIKPKKTNTVGFHSGDMGDVIYCIPTMKALNITKLYLNPNRWYGTKMKEKQIDLLKPLLTSQGIEVKIPGDQELLSFDYDLDAQRYTNQDMLWNHLGLCQANAAGVKVKLKEKWIHEINPCHVADVIINRTNRYHNSFIDWVEIINAIPKTKRILFVGLEAEYNDFQKIVENDDIEYRPAKNLQALAEYIAGADLFIGNQSTPYAIAEGLKVNRIQETCEYNSNCQPSGGKCFSFINPNDMPKAKKFIKEVFNGK